MTVRGASRLEHDPGWLLTVRNVADRLSCSCRTVERLIESGQLPHVRPTPAMVRIHPEDLRVYLEARHQEAALARPVRLTAGRPGSSSPRRNGSARPTFLDQLAAVER